MEQRRDFRPATWVHGWIDPYLLRVAGVIAGLRISPNLLTVIGFSLSTVTGVLLAGGKVMLAGWVLLVGAMCDVLDGPLAKATNQTSALGAFLDSTLDQLGDGLIFVGLIWLGLQRQSSLEVVLAFVTFAGALMVSYIRARAGWLGVECRQGPVGRFERTLLTIIGLITGQIRLLLWTLVIVVNYTMLRRFVCAVSATQRLGDER